MPVTIQMIVIMVIEQYFHEVLMDGTMVCDHPNISTFDSCGTVRFCNMEFGIFFSFIQFLNCKDRKNAHRCVVLMCFNPESRRRGFTVE